jgi:antitoxin component YwqK of YwqJK toxin-antitoxin module
MRWLFLILGFSFGLSAQVNQVDAKGRKQGEWVKYYESSKVPQYIGQFKDDKPVGKFTYYYPNNKIKAIVIHDEKSGRSESFMYHENKQLMAHGIYRNMKKDSIWSHYGPSGRISFQETYKDDVLHGKKTIYYVPEDPLDKRAIVAQEMNFVNGRLHGENKEYFPDGKLKKEATYVEGVYDGVVKHYHPSNGRLHLEERWKNRMKHGWWMTYDANGKELGRTYYFKNSVYEGEKLKRHLENCKKRGVHPNHC